jgi:hypothetical protein
LAKLDLTIETDQYGNNVVVFARRNDDLVPPRHYDQRLEWIRSSFDQFLGSVRDLEEIRRASALPL